MSENKLVVNGSEKTGDREYKSEVLKKSMDPVQQYRQPMVTATGIFLGFLLNFTSSWMPNAFTQNRNRDIVLAIGVTISLASLLVVLFRMLRMGYPTHPEKFYRKTLSIFLIGITIPFFSFILVAAEKIIANW